MKCVCEELIKGKWRRRRKRRGKRMGGGKRGEEDIDVVHQHKH